MWGRGRPYTWSMAGSGAGSATLKSLEEERGRHIKALASEDSFLLILPLLLAWGPLAWGLSPLPGSGPVEEHADWASGPGRAGSHPGSSIPGCVASGTWLTLARPRLEKGFGKTTSEDCCKCLLERPMPGVCSLRQSSDWTPFCLSSPGTGPTSAAESPGLSFKPTEGDAENPLEHRGMHEKELEQRHPRPPGPYLTVDWYTRSSRLR